MQYTDKDRSIISQVAAKAAVELVTTGVTADGTVMNLRAAAYQVQNLIFELAEAPTNNPAPAAAVAAPVLQAVPAMAAAPAPAPAQAQAVVAPVATDFAAEIAASQAVQAEFPQSQLSSAPPFPGDTKDKSQKAANADWARTLLAHDASQFWDNRADKAAGLKKATFPDFKHKDSGVGIWLD